MSKDWAAQELKDLCSLEQYRKTNDESILDGLAKRFEGLCRAAVNRLCGRCEIYDPEVKKDLLADAHVGLLRALKTYKPTAGKLSCWCYSKAYRYAQNGTVPKREPNEITFSNLHMTSRRGQESGFADDSYIASAALSAEWRYGEHGEYNQDPASPDQENKRRVVPNRPRFEFVPIKRRSSEDPFADDPYASDGAWSQELAFGEQAVELVYENTISRLPYDLRQTVRWYLIENLTQVQIAERLEISQPAVCKRLAKAEEMLRTGNFKPPRFPIDRSGERNDMATHRRPQIQNGRWRVRAAIRREEELERQYMRDQMNGSSRHPNNNSRSGEQTDDDRPKVVIFSHGGY